MWRSLEELAVSPEFEELLHREFPRQATELEEGVDRRRFLQLMSASLALGGITACTRQPPEKIVPYVNQPESIIPGRPMFFASSMVLDGIARPVIVESHMGRPTKVEGNPDHPASSGATDLITQASLLTLYDPERSQVVKNNGRIRTWDAFVEETKSTLTALRALGGARLRILTRPVTSPTETALIDSVLQSEPRAKWHQYAPVSRDAEIRGLETAFGQTASPIYDLTQADVIVSLDSEFSTQGPGSVRYAKDFASRRRVREDGARISRF
jgi:molybdopterin-containing oxidoreductase family iron-sulfur binding subunit